VNGPSKVFVDTGALQKPAAVPVAPLILHFGPGDALFMVAELPVFTMV
jgi:hypothetical protein